MFRPGMRRSYLVKLVESQRNHLRRGREKLEAMCLPEEGTIKVDADSYTYLVWDGASQHEPELLEKQEPERPQNPILRFFHEIIYPAIEIKRYSLIRKKDGREYYHIGNGEGIISLRINILPISIPIDILPYE